MPKRTTSKAAASQMKPAAIRQFHVKLHAWYQTHGRHDLPWRNTADPYRIWVSEVMLQQTQVSTVRDRFYGQFLDKFPNVGALAAAPREAVMRAWEGLGYYRRAGFLHEAAKTISALSPRACPGVHLDCAKKDGSRRKAGMTVRGDLAFPDTIDDLLQLPGIGRNTAHAILAFAYHQPVAILEANVKRVVARIFALETPSDAELWKGAEDLLNKGEAFDYNQSMMDLGAMICTPKNPNCGACPARSICAGKASPERYPALKVKKQVPVREVMIVVREDARGRLFLEKRDAKLLGGLYGFVQSPHPTHLSGASASPKGEARKPRGRRDISSDALAESLGVPLPWERSKRLYSVSGEGYLGAITHTYSHFKLIGHVVMEKSSIHSNSPDWYSRAEIAALPLSTLDHKVLALVDKCNTDEKKCTKRVVARVAR